MKAAKLPSGNYRVRIFVKTASGKQIRKSFTGPGKKEVEREAQRYLLEHKEAMTSGSNRQNIRRCGRSVPACPGSRIEPCNGKNIQICSEVPCVIFPLAHEYEHTRSDHRPSAENCR